MAFQKGCIPWNKGKKLPFTVWNKGISTGLVPKTAFKKGHTPWSKGTKGLVVSWNKGSKGLQEAWNKGKKMSLEHREKMREGWKKLLSEGKFIPHTAFRKGQEPWNKGKKLGFTPKGAFKKGLVPHNKGIPMSEEVKQKLREANLGRKHSKETRKKCSESHKGSKSYLWKGGITPQNHIVRNSIEYRLWRESVFARDHWNCQDCGKKGYLNAHHIKHFSTHPELRFAIDNGITLCSKCHNKVHTKIKAINESSEPFRQ